MNVNKDKMNIVSAQKREKLFSQQVLVMLWSGLNLVSMPILQHK